MTYKVGGLDGTLQFVDQLAPAARDQLVVELAILSRELSAAQYAEAPRATGALAAALSYQVTPENLRARIGLLLGGRDAGKFNGRSFKARAGGPFYGRFVEFGRKAQTVVVTRHLARRVVGNGRGKGRRVLYAGKPYTMRVSALPPRPFVAQPLLEQVVDRSLADFWSQVLNRTTGSTA